MALPRERRYRQDERSKLIHELAIQPLERDGKGPVDELILMARVVDALAQRGTKPRRLPEDHVL